MTGLAGERALGLIEVDLVVVVVVVVVVVAVVVVVHGDDSNVKTEKAQNPMVVTDTSGWKC